MARRADAPAAKSWEDLCRVTGLGRDAVKAAMQSGELPGYLIGSRYVCPAEAFDDFLHGRWVPMHRTVLSAPPTPLPQPTSLIKRKAS